MSRVAIRTVVKDIIDIIKNNKKGEFYLPKNQDEYEFINLPLSFGVELYLIQDLKLNKFILQSYFLKDTDIIEIAIKYNPKKIRTQLFV